VSLKDLQEKWTPLHFACQGGHEEVVRILLAAGALLEVQSDVSPSLFDC
jgi:ankyrin repeat protein